MHNNPASPSSRFICWLGLMDRLRVKTKLHTWVVVDSDKCVICGAATETVAQLLFQCDFSRKMWQQILALLNMDRQVMRWEEGVKMAVKKARME